MVEALPCMRNGVGSIYGKSRKEKGCEMGYICG